MSQNPPNVENYVVCPYNNTHLLMWSRMAMHLTRCARNYPSSKLVRCTFNSTHLYLVDDMKKHVANCPDREIYVCKLKTDKMPPSVESGPREFVVESSEDWDNEPAAPTYDPQTHCDAAFVIRNLQGAPPAMRRKFRQNERMKLMALSTP